MNINFKVTALVVLAAPVLTGCIDDKYDLANVDTTSEFKVKDLVLPVNIDPVTLNDIINIKDGDQIKIVTINGETFYAVQETGTFESDDIEVNKFNAESSPMEPNHAYFDLKQPASKPARKAGSSSKVYAIRDEVYEPLDYSADDVDPSVRSLSYLYFTATDGSDLSFVITVNTSSLPGNLTSYVSDMTLKLPVGLQVKNVLASGYTFAPKDYNAATGLLSLSRVNVVDNKLTVNVISDAIDLSTYSSPLVYDSEEDVSRFSLDSEFSISTGCTLTVEGDDDALAALPDQFEFDVTYDVDDLLANAIMGEIEYDLEGTGLEIEPISLENIPDFLSDPETNLMLANPQLYISMDNPVGEFGLGYQSGLKIVAMRDGGEETDFPLGDDMTVAGKPGDFYFLLAPDPDAVKDTPTEYPNPERMVYNNLGNILAGAGIPQSLDVDLIDPMIPQQKTTAPFELGVKIPGMKGSYEFLAPLALQGDSRIIYTKTEDGWWSDDLEGLDISSLTVSNIATSTVPLDATIAVYPLDRDGNRIQGLDIQTAVLPAYAKDAPIELTISGNITNLDGVFITATVVPDGNEEALSPDQTITMRDIRAKVSATYTKKL